jgi:perosamine synthetase
MMPFSRPFLGQAELDAVGKIFDSRWLGLGAVTKQFEDQLRALLAARHVIAVNTGTSALHVALAAIDLKEGDEVIVPSMTFIASIQSILAAGATPVFCDILDETLNLDPADVARRVTSRTKAIMPVHYAGVACDMDALGTIAHDHHLRIVEDAAHAFGSSYRGRKIGTIGDLTCFSFDPIKNITCGEGGAVATDDDELARRIIPRRNVGIDSDVWSRRDANRPWHYEVHTTGFRYHMPNLNAAIGIEQLKRMEDFRAQKIAIVRRYDAAFANLPGVTLLKHDLAETFPFMYVIRVKGRRRDAMMAFLKERGIASGVNYIPCHLQPLLARQRVSLPVTERTFDELLTLPLYVEMTDDDVARVIDAVCTFAQQVAK